MTNTPSSIAYKVWRKILSGRRSRFSGVCLRPFPRKRLHVLKDCELIEEAFLPLLLRGASIHRAPQPPTFRDLKVVERDDDVEWVRDVLAAHDLDTEPGGSKLAWGAGLNAGLAHAAPRIRSLLAHVFGELGRWEREASESYEALRAGDEILTSSLNATSQRLFAFYCRQKGIRINTVDHGVTLGLSKWSLFHANFSGMGLGDRGFYHCRRARDLMMKSRWKQEGHSVGLPSQTTSKKFRALKRALARRFVGAVGDQQLVMIVGDLPRNNFIYGPHSDNDLQFYEKTRAIIDKVCSEFPNSRVIFKSYPTERYLDHYDFSDQKKKHPNLRILSDAEFRFVRHAADLIFTSSTQSTLGWVHGTGVPYFLVEFKWAPGLVGGLHVEENIKAGRAIYIFPDDNEICNGKSGDLALLCMDTTLSQTYDDKE